MSNPSCLRMQSECSPALTLLLHPQFIPKLSHEADGLIFQPWESPYIIGTANDLLKWKYAHLNSVDFKFMDNSGRAFLPEPAHAPSVDLLCKSPVFDQRGTSDVSY